MNSPRCQLYLRVPARLEPGAARDCLTAALEAGDVAALLVRRNGPEETLVNMLEALLPLAQARNVAVVVAGAEELAQLHGADGIEVTDRPSYDAARKRLGASAIVGADCGASRHFAMEIAEAGADYVGLVNGGEGGRELIAWWAELFEVPCVAVDPVEPDEAGALAGLGADFVRPSDTMWDSPEHTRTIVSQSLCAIEEGTR